MDVNPVPIHDSSPQSNPDAGTDAAHDPAVEAPTEIFVPEIQYPDGYTVQFSDGEYEIDTERQMLIYRHSSALNYHHVHITPKS